MKGVVGVYSKDDAVQKALNILYGVQHRGQESSGISAAGDHYLRTWNGPGLVSKVFHEQIKSFIHPNDYIVIGCASGENAKNGNLPPVEYENENYKMALTLDGHITDGEGRFNEEVVGKNLLEKLKASTPDQAVAEMMKDLSDSYFSLVIIFLDKATGSSELFVARDRRGVRPLFIGHNHDEIFAASESAPLDVLEAMGGHIEMRLDVKPGSYIVKSDDRFEERQVLEPRPAHCVFEWVYFGRPDSVMEGKNVHFARKRLGHALVETHRLKEEYGVDDRKFDNSALIPVPDSGRSVCTGVAEAMGVTHDEGVIKNAYLGRTYIIEDPDFRKVASDLKHNIIKETVNGKRVIICDDSIVRGTVSESVAKNLREAGAAEVDFLVSYAPIYYPCFSDPPDKPLAAAAYKGKTLEEIGDLVASNLPSIDKVRYNSPDNVIRAVGLPTSHLCMFCVTGVSPFEG